MSQTRTVFADIRSAAGNIKGAVMDTPCLASETLSRIAGCELFLKFENLQFTASFKERGALNKLLSLDTTQRAFGVCAMSAGNHAQGVAYHARRLGIPATIVMPEGTPATKITRTRDHDARVIVAGANLNEALDIALKESKEHFLSFIHPYDDPLVIAGQGTMAMEILQSVPDIDAIIVPIGGGGLISGTAIAAKHMKSDIKIIGVQSQTYPSMQRAMCEDDIACADALTIAEGIAVKTAGLLTREYVRELVDDILLVDEATIEHAIALLMSVEKTVCEGAGAVGFAATLAHPEKFKGMKVAVPLTGGNIDLRMIAAVAMREMSRRGQLLALEVPINDQPGATAKLTTVIGNAGGNIINIAHERHALDIDARFAVLKLSVEVENREHGEQVKQAVIQNDFEFWADR